MSGSLKVALVTLLCVVGLAGLNLAMWRRARAAVAEGRRRERERVDEGGAGA